MKLYFLNSNKPSSPKTEEKTVQQNWSHYSENYVDAKSRDGYEVSGSKGAAQFGLNYVKYRDKKKI